MDLKGYFSKMHDTINRPQYNNAAVVSQFIFEQLKEGRTLSDCEKALREIGSRVHLIGLPLESFNKGLESFNKGGLSSKLPNSPKEFRYALWICMNGEDEVKELIEDHDKVDQSLEKTGLLTVASIPSKVKNEIGLS